MTAYTPILATLAYILSPDKRSVLMIHRNTRPDDLHYGKYNGLGGKLSDAEDIISGLVREIEEESGLTATDIKLRGTISWPGFGKNDEAWFGFIFRVDAYSGEAHKGNVEGALEWIDVDKIADLNLWESDRLWLDMVFDDSPKMFHGIAPFKDGKLVSWNFQRI
ncbi:MAG: 7,8-dihydro-8-oxoguanine triphosphatase [Candidatus Melainabacteria bacterium]|nr:MAG: 7,8-dihydro-8-oxoguanine triphosphatase [Candidatus Melainabacteria bacterium]